jgi:hypothetical protein
MSGVTDG